MDVGNSGITIQVVGPWQLGSFLSIRCSSVKPAKVWVIPKKCLETSAWHLSAG